MCYGYLFECGKRKFPPIFLYLGLWMIGKAYCLTNSLSILIKFCEVYFCYVLFNGFYVFYTNFMIGEWFILTIYGRIICIFCRNTGCYLTICLLTCGCGCGWGCGCLTCIFDWSRYTWGS